MSHAKRKKEIVHKIYLEEPQGKSRFQPKRVSAWKDVSKSYESHQSVQIGARFQLLLALGRRQHEGRR